MRDLQKDMEWLTAGQDRYDLSDEYLIENKCPNERSFFADRVSEWSYGITFVESDIAREWLERAIKSEALVTERNQDRIIQARYEQQQRQKEEWNNRK